MGYPGFFTGIGFGRKNYLQFCIMGIGFGRGNYQFCTKELVSGKLIAFCTKELVSRKLINAVLYQGNG